MEPSSPIAIGSAPDSPAAGQPLVFAGEGLIELTLDGEVTRLDYGGDAANAAAMCASLGGHARLLGRVGDDPLGRRLVSFWSGRGVDTSALRIDREAPTGLYVNELPPPGTRGTRTFTYWRRGSAGSRWSPEDVVDPEIVSDAAAVVVTGVTASISRSSELAVWDLLERARSRSVPTVCVLNFRAPLDPDRVALAKLAGAVDVLIASVEDLAEVFPERHPTELLRRTGDGGRELVITDGGAGASVGWDGGQVRQRVLPVAVADTVGAGDALAGAYLWARFGLRQQPAAALAWGAAAALISVQREGCARSYPNACETAAVRERLPQAEPYHELRVEVD